jgi:hypothetical protein
MTTLRLRVVMVMIAAVAFGAVAMPVFASENSSRASQSGSLALYELSCPSTRQCTAIDGMGREITFNPQSPRARPAHHKVLNYASSLSCPSTSLCVVVNGLNPGHAVAFAPRSGQILKAFKLPNLNTGTIDGNNALACVGVNQCTAVTFEGELTFNPTTGHTISKAILTGASEGYDDVVCTSRTACTTLFQDTTGEVQGRVLTFDPATGTTSGSGATLINGTAGLESLACPSATQCTAGDHSGDEVTFDPSTGQLEGAGKVTLRTRAAVEALSCPSVSQCTARNSAGQDVTFNPRTGVRGKLHQLGPGLWIEIDCPSVTQCTATGGHGDEETFKPAKGVGTIHTIDY